MLAGARCPEGRRARPQGAEGREAPGALGQPVSMTTHDDGQLTANYEYVVGNEPSTGRAMGHGVLDVLTLGLWEVVGTPIEAVNQGDKITVTVRYDQRGRAVDIKSSKL